jgi:hypothetical protein
LKSTFSAIPARLPVAVSSRSRSSSHLRSHVQRSRQLRNLRMVFRRMMLALHRFSLRSCQMKSVSSVSASE